MGHFEKARDLLRASLVSCFGQEHQLTLDNGQSSTALGYVKASEKEGVKAHHFYCDAKIQLGSRLLYKGKRYSLVFEGMANGKSQIMREYLMSLPIKNQPQGGTNGWSEFKDVD